jgi:hypothetical protein
VPPGWRRAFCAAAMHVRIGNHFGADGGAPVRTTCLRFEFS